jgi:hypothetical protein
MTDSRGEATRWAYLEDEHILYKGKALFVSEDDEGRYSITHGPSGLRVHGHRGFYSKENAIKWLIILEVKHDWAEGWTPSLEHASGNASDEWRAQGRKLALLCNEHSADGEPERGRDEAYDTLDSDLDGPVVGMGIHGQVWVADVNYHGIISGYNEYHYIPESDTCDGQAYWSGGNWYRELELDGWTFPSGIEVGELDEYHDVAPSGISIEDAEEWSGAYTSETLHYCEECSKHFDSECNYRSRYVEEWGDCFCDSCSEDLVSSGKICAAHSQPECEEDECRFCSECVEPFDDCECEGESRVGHDSPEEPSDGMTLRDGYISNEITVSMDSPRWQFKRELEAACWESFSHNEKRAILDGRIDEMLAEVA